MSIKITELMDLVSPAGQQQFVDFVQKAKQERGAGWLESIKADYPMFCWIADLVANHDAPEAFDQLQTQFPKMPLTLLKSKLFSLHAALKAEIDRPR